MTALAPLVLAKAPVAGRVKTRLAADVGDREAADLAAAALLDTLAAVAEAFPDAPHVLALAGDLADAERSADLAEALAGWRVVAQRGEDFASRLAHAHADTYAATGLGTLQVGMDTPHLDAGVLRRAAADLAGHDGVLGLAEDGGWWALGLRDPRHAELLRPVPMSHPETGARTWSVLGSVLSMATTTPAYDVDTVREAARAAADAPGTRFAHTWRALAGEAVR